MHLRACSHRFIAHVSFLLSINMTEKYSISEKVMLDLKNVVSGKWSQINLSGPCKSIQLFLGVSVS